MAAPARNREETGLAGGLDILAQLNLSGPRDFLLQVEDDLEAFVLNYLSECKEEEEGTPPRLVFPPLSCAYEALLAAACRRFGLKTAPVHRRRVRTGPQQLAAVTTNRSALPLMTFADVLRVQRPPGPASLISADRMTPAMRKQRLALRLWALRVARSQPASLRGTAKKEEKQEVKEDDEAALRGLIDEALKDQAARCKKRGGRERSRSGSVRRDWGPPNCTKTPARGRGAQKPAAQAAAEPPAAQASQDMPARHCYERFSQKAAQRIYSREDFVRAPWPSAKLRRLPEPPVIWRPEWRVGPDGEDAAEPGALGGILSFAVEPEHFSFGEGFEVNMRSGPGPPPPPPSVQARVKVEDDRDEDDFVLSFRRGDGVWHFTAGRRGRAGGGGEKSLPDDSFVCSGVRGSLRHMFWVACTEGRADGKHYVVVGRVPGVLTEHFFVAKTARAEPLSHLGFSYLPDPGHAAFGSPAKEQEPPALVIESITVFPHGLTGELPFLSLQYLEQRQDDATRAALPKDGELVCMPIGKVAADDTEESAPCEVTVLVVRRQPVAAEQHASSWCAAARREIALPPTAKNLEEEDLANLVRDLGALADPQDIQRIVSEQNQYSTLSWEEDNEEERAARIGRRVRRRTEKVVLAHGLEAPSSWEPHPCENPPKLGPFDEALLHSPQKWPRVFPQSA